MQCNEMLFQSLMVQKANALLQSLTYEWLSSFIVFLIETINYSWSLEGCCEYFFLLQQQRCHPSFLCRIPPLLYSFFSYLEQRSTKAVPSLINLMHKYFHVRNFHNNSVHYFVPPNRGILVCNKAQRKSCIDSLIEKIEKLFLKFTNRKKNLILKTFYFVSVLIANERNFTQFVHSVSHITNTRLKYKYKQNYES